MQKDDLTAAQLALEEESITMGIQHYREMRERSEADLPPGQRLIKAAVGRMAASLKAYFTECEGCTPTRSAGLYYFLQQWQAEPELPAYVTCRAVIDAFGGKLKLQAVALVIAHLLEDQIDHDVLRAVNPKAYRQLLKKINKSTDAGYRHTVLRKQQKFTGIKAHRWDTSDRVRVGVFLIEMAQEATVDLFRVDTVMEGKNDTPLYVLPTASTVAWLNTSHSRCEYLTPSFLPMVVKPRPWTNPFNGGYLNKKMRFGLIKGANHRMLEELREIEMPMVYQSLNALQDTAWAVNMPLYRTLVECWDGGGNLGGLPPRNDLPLPARDFTDEEALAQAENFKQWKTRAAKVYERNVALRSKRIQMQCKLWVAEKMSKFEQFFFAHSLDFRGRAYSQGAFLNPQGDDSAKALLCFAEGVELGQNGARWMAIHGANCFGVDKVSFDDRTKWIDENLDAISESANNPLDGSRWWTQADSPWQFLAFCLEWRKLQVWVATGHTAESFVSHLVVGVDGACNGLQNFSAMLRDEVGGRATNLIPSDKPADIYAEVAAEASQIIAKDAAGGNEVAQRWVGKVTRKLTKRNTMTVPYAVTAFGMSEQLMEEFKSQREEDECDFTVAEATIKDAIYLARVNSMAIGRVVVAAVAAMAWLKEVAHVVAEDGLPVQWLAPSGFLVVQDYREIIGDRINLTFLGKRLRLTLDRKGDKLNRRKQASGISPNFVHALDAAHLQRTVCMCQEQGIESFAMIHDSYGTHAGGVDVMAQLLRSAFVEQYSPDVLNAFRGQLIAQLRGSPKLAEKIPPVPPMGTLELAAVMNSDYFFA